MNKTHLLLLGIIVLASEVTLSSHPVYFGLDGTVRRKSAAVAELLPWKAPDARLFLADERIDYLGDGAYSVTRSIRNTSGDTVRFKDEIRVLDAFRAHRYLVPCVNYNGNEFGDVKTPKGLTYNGEPWVFSYERTGVPSCTLTENESTGLALFSAADTPQSLVSSCSLEKKADGRFEHVIVRPVTEAPVTYESKGVFGPRYDTYIELAPGETFTAKSYVCICPPRWRHFAAASLVEKALVLLDPQLEPCLDDDQVFELGIRYVHSLLYLYKGKWLVNEHYTNRMAHDCAAMMISREEMAERMKYEYWTDLGTYCQTFEIGWAGQNFLNARMLAVKALRNADQDLLDKAIGIYDAFVQTQHPSGLLYTSYNHNFDENAPARRKPDVCNMGWAAAEAVRMFRLLADHGIYKDAYLEFARRIGDFFIDHWSDEWGFGKSYYIDGRPDQKAGTIGSFLIPALVELYEQTKENRYLDAAVKAEDFYFTRDLDRFECTAGAIDCYCIDKETSWPLVNGALKLYGITGDSIHLERAEKAAYYFTSWMFFFDGIYGPETDCSVYGYHTTGGTSVSTEHMGIDTWGEQIVPDLLELSSLTGNASWERIARLMWANSLQGITTRKGQLIHGQQRPVGSQSEAVCQARFTKYRPVIEAGYFTDILAPWPSAFRMWSVERMRARGWSMRDPENPCRPTM